MPGLSDRWRNRERLSPSFLVISNGLLRRDWLVSFIEAQGIELSFTEKIAPALDELRREDRHSHRTVRATPIGRVLALEVQAVVPTSALFEG